MNWICAIVTLVAVVTNSRSAHLRATTPSYYDPYHLPPPPFSEPGLVFADYTVADLISIAGAFWNADTIVDAGRQVCERMEQDLTSYLSNARFDIGILKTVCDSFESANVEEKCGALWDDLVLSLNRPDWVNGSVSLIPDLRCRRSVLPDPSPPRGSLDTVTLRDFNIYDPCSESGIEKINNLLFALVDWVGPSLLDTIPPFSSEPYSMCGIIRFLLSEGIVDLSRGAINVVKYPVADILEEFRSFDICALSQLDERGAEAIGGFKDLLVELSDLDEAAFCAFIAGRQTREAYLEQGEAILLSILELKRDEQSCRNVLSIVAPFDEFSYFLQITGYDLSEESDRGEFCTLFVEAYDPSSTYLPAPYEVPSDTFISFPFNGDPGDVYPGLTFVDLVMIDGIAGRGPKLLDAIAVYCTVFEDVLSSSVRQDVFDVSGFCSLIRQRNLAAVESFCVSNHPDFRRTYPEDRPLWLRPFVNPVNEGAYVLQRLLGVMDISKEAICPAVGRLVNEISIANLVERGLDILLTETLPYAHSLCRNWEEAMCRWRPLCPVPGESPSPSSTQLHRPTPDWREALNPVHDRKIAQLASLISLVFGFDNREATCDFIAGAIDPLSGRADETFVARMRATVLSLLSDANQCSHAIDLALGLFTEEQLPYNFPVGDYANIVPQLTGFDSSHDFCQAVAKSFGATPGVTSSPELPITSSEGKNTYKVIANIVLHIQRVARSI